MGVVILKWNPGFSSYAMVRFLNDLEKRALANDGDADMNWSIRDFDRVHPGDTCYMLKVGYGQTGIVARGTITSEAYAGEDWAWRNRPTKYCDFIFDTMINPDAYPLLDSRTLSQAIPEFDWTGGPSGVVLTDEQAATLEKLWTDYLQRQRECFDKASDQNLFMVTPPEVSDSIPYTMELDDDYRGHQVVIKFEEGKVCTKLTIVNYHRSLGKFGVKSWRMLRRTFAQNYPTAESLQQLCADLFRHQIEFTTDFYTLSDS